MMQAKPYLLVLALVLSGALLFTGCDPLSGKTTATESDGQSPPPPAPIPPNASRVTADVLEFAKLNSTLVNQPPERTLYALTLKVDASEDVDDMNNYVSSGQTIRAFTRDTLSMELFGDRVRLIVKKVGEIDSQADTNPYFKIDGEVTQLAEDE